MNFESISSLQNPRVKRVVRLRDRRDRDRERLFLIEGFRELSRAVQGGCALSELYFCPELFLGANEPALLERVSSASGAAVFEVSRLVFEKMTYRDRPEGLLAVAPQPEWRLDHVGAAPTPLYLVVVAVEKPGNLGTMLRTADAAGVDAVIVCDRCTDLFNPNVVRASIGTLFTVPIAEATTDELLPWLTSRAVRIAAATPAGTAIYSESKLDGPLAFVVGSEQYGLPERWLTAATERLRIPMHGRADSLNVAVATAVLLFEAQRQRRAGRSG